MTPATVGSLCTGYQGLEMALEALTDIDTRWTADNDPDVTNLLEQRAAPPNLGDITARPEAPPVDIITAGFPCQPLSTAGWTAADRSGYWNPEPDCGAEATIASPPEGPQVILHCNEPTGHRGDHRLTVTWPRPEQETSPCQN